MLVFAALADPVRRQIVEALVEGDATAGAIARRFPVSRPAVSRHLRVLREAGLVRAAVRGKERVYALDRAALADLDRWLDRFRPLPAGALPADRALPGPAGRLDALGTELHRGRRERRTATNEGRASDERSTG